MYLDHYRSKVIYYHSINYVVIWVDVYSDIVVYLSVEIVNFNPKSNVVMDAVHTHGCT